MFETLECKTICQSTRVQQEIQIRIKHSCEKISSKSKGNAMQAVDVLILSTSTLYAVQKDAYHMEVKKKKTKMFETWRVRRYARRPESSRKFYFVESTAVKKQAAN